MTRDAQGNEAQIPELGQELGANYNSIELITTLTPDQILSDYVQTFALFKLDSAGGSANITQRLQQAGCAR